MASKTLSSIKKNVSSENTTVYVDVWIKRTEKRKVGFDFPETRQIFITCNGWKFSKRNLTNRLIWPMILTNLRTRRTRKKSNTPWLDCTIKREITNIYQWRIQERGPEDPSALPPSLILDQNEARRTEKKLFETGPHPPYLKVWIGHCTQSTFAKGDTVGNGTSDRLILERCPTNRQSKIWLYWDWGLNFLSFFLFFLFFSLLVLIYSNFSF